MPHIPKEPIEKGAILLAALACAFTMLSITAQAAETAPTGILAWELAAAF